MRANSEISCVSTSPYIEVVTRRAPCSAPWDDGSGHGVRASASDRSFRVA